MDGLPAGSDGKQSACNPGDLGSVPGSGRSPGEGKDRNGNGNFYVPRMFWLEGGPGPALVGLFLSMLPLGHCRPAGSPGATELSLPWSFCVLSISWACVVT